MGASNAGEHHDQLLRELAEERVAALTRIARTLERLIEQLKSLRDSIEVLNGPPREQQRRAYDEVREQALRYRWYLDVQREAIGLRPHESVDNYYQVPGPLA
jgi:hypothetical protein